MIKLFGNSGGSHYIERETPSVMDRLVKWWDKPSAITFGDALKASLVVLFGLCVFTLILISARAETPTEETTAVQTVAQVEAPTPTAEPAEIVMVDQTLALAQGIDAVVSSECGNMVSDATMVMVGNVIMNRTEDSRYPDTVDQVLMQPKQFSCFSESGMKWVGRAANDAAFQKRCMNAAEAAMSGERLLSYSVVYVSGVKQGSVEAQLDGLYFCK